MSDDDSETESREILLAVYGTLKKGFKNYRYYLAPREPLFQGFALIPFQMFSNGNFPLLFPSLELKNIFLEVYNIPEKVLQEIDQLEGVPIFYSRIEFYLAEINKIVYLYVVLNKEPYGDEVEDGNFQK